MKWTEALVIDAIRSSYLPPPEHPTPMEEWALLTQVPLRSLTPQGEAALAAGQKIYAQWVNERTIDAFIVRNWSGGKHGHERLAIEVKVSIQDYRNETDEKRAPAEASAHRCAYAAPAGLIDPATLPPGWGLIEVSDAVPRMVWRKHAVRRTPTCDLDYLVTAGFRRASRAEERIRAGDSAPAEVARLRDEHAKMASQLHTAQQGRKREENRAKMARSELLSIAGDQECADCFERVTWRRGGTNDSCWSHVDPGQDGRCYEQRREIDRLKREAETGTTYAWGIPAAVEPKALRDARLALDAVQEAS